jgi:hypothetical protein
MFDAPANTPIEECRDPVAADLKRRAHRSRKASAHYHPHPERPRRPLALQHALSLEKDVGLMSCRPGQQVERGFRHKIPLSVKECWRFLISISTIDLYYRLQVIGQQEKKGLDCFLRLIQQPWLPLGLPHDGDTVALIHYTVERGSTVEFPFTTRRASGIS